MTPIKAILFDLDGTLADTLADLADSANFALCECGFAPHPICAYRYFVGNGIAVMLARAAGITVDDARLALLKEKFLPYYAVHFCDKTTPYAGMPETIDALRNKGIRLAVVTNKVDAMAQTIVQTLYPDQFRIICGQQDGYPCKPDPALTLDVMAKLGVTPAECIFLGDSDADMQTAKNAGALAVGALWGFRTSDELLQNGADHLLEKPEDLLLLINQ